MSFLNILKSVFRPSYCPRCGAYYSRNAQGRCTMCGAYFPQPPDADPTSTARRRAKDWWLVNRDRRTAACDRCSQDIGFGEGYLVTPGMFGGSDLYCEACWRSSLGQTPVEDIPDHNGLNA